MSRTETHYGKIRKIDLSETTIEQWCEAKCRELGETGLESYNNTWEEQLRGLGYRKYFFNDGEVWESFDHVEGESEDIEIMLPNTDGSITFVMQFYNGGTCLSEMIEHGLKELKNQKSI